MKKILVTMLIIFSIIYIYLLTIDKKIYYLAFTNNPEEYSNSLAKHLDKSNKLEKYINKFSDSNIRVSDYINKIKENEEVLINHKKTSIKNALIKADLITISLNIQDIEYYINSIDNYIVYKKDIELLLSLIRQYSKEDIFLVGFDNENSNEKFVKFNNDLKELCKTYNIIYLDLFENNSKEYIINEITLQILS